MDGNMMSGNGHKSIVVYMVSRHPLETRNEVPPFQWVQRDNGFIEDIQGLVGSFDPSDLSILMDEQPAGSAWITLLDNLVGGRVQTVITHLAPLSPGQRQQLIGVCACSGARLITPGDGGRNSFLSYRVYRS